jgi:uncharacterized protein with von Willebrand factor type A (vWA) domain
MTSASGPGEMRSADGGRAVDVDLTDDVASAERMAVGFVRVLRGAEMTVPVGSAILFVDALGKVGLEDPSAVFWAGRSTLVHRPEDIPVYDRAFEVYWTQFQPGAASLPEPEVQAITLAIDDEDGLPEGGDDILSSDTISVRFSAVEVLSDKDFSLYSASELDEAQRLMAAMRFNGATRPSRRLAPSNAQRGRLDLRRTVRAATRTGGEPLQVHRMHQRTRVRRLVLLLDVSGSMEAYARALLRFVQAAVVARRRVEAFALGTRLTRLTRELSSRDPDRALAAASGSVQDWSGGTRLGEGLRAFNDEWGVRGLARGSIVVMLSDGWDRGDPEELGAEMERLSRVTHRLVWVNPLKASPGYAPLARGMAAALPHVDHFIEGHSLNALDELAQLLGTIGTRGES